MSRKSTTIGVRMSEETARVIKRISASQERTPSDLLGAYAEEIARQHQFCHLEFRDTPSGRLAYIEGTRTPVWLIVDFVRQYGGKIEKAARIHEWSENRIRAAVNYARAFPDEIEPLIERAHAMTPEKLRQLNAA